jgi:hypothetical protein
MSIEQEATDMFAAELAAFLEEAIAKLDALAPGPPAEREKHPEPEKPAKKPRKKKAARREDEPQPLPVEPVGEAAVLSHLVDAVGDAVDGAAVPGGQAADPATGDFPLQLDHREQAA